MQKWLNLEYLRADMAVKPCQFHILQFLDVPDGTEGIAVGYDDSELGVYLPVFTYSWVCASIPGGVSLSIMSATVPWHPPMRL